ncbi:hypothetical protein E3E12_07625 [Formicincola oecophyllae]|uniref:Uncharacterized protein n=1 Tax=Formicincola oecophyllae TaxID=2558361 RepID=A0A4Y6UC92_9PROT|nr:hypothetical protein [Formicincola oecophyllae]QDH14067.1 hypothetical protein E3E12_07625 [Formicincola oecophyllae]
MARTATPATRKASAAKAAFTNVPPHPTSHQARQAMRLLRLYSHELERDITEVHCTLCQGQLCYYDLPLLGGGHGGRLDAAEVEGALEDIRTALEEMESCLAEARARVEGCSDDCGGCEDEGGLDDDAWFM